MVVVDATDPVLHDVHRFQWNREQFNVVFVTVKLLNVHYKALSILHLHFIISRLCWDPLPVFVGDRGLPLSPVKYLFGVLSYFVEPFVFGSDDDR